MQEILSKSKIGSRIKDLRLSRGFSQQLVANFLGLSRSNYSQIELGNQFPNYDVLLRLAIFYDTNYEWLLHGRQLGLSTYPMSSAFPDQPLGVDLRETDKVRLVRNEDYASYLTSAGDAAYINSLGELKPPAGHTEGSIFRTFQINDCSMEGSYLKDDLVLSQSLTNLSDLKNGEAYIIVTADQVMMRYVNAYIYDSDLLIAKAENPIYSPELIPLSSIREIWQVWGIFSTPLSNIVENMGRGMDKFEYSIFKLRQKVQFIQQKENKRILTEGETIVD